MKTPDSPGRIAIGRRLDGWPGITCLGPRACLADYSARELGLIRAAKIIYYPTMLLAAPLAALGKVIYPSLECHQFGQSKIRQHNLFRLAGLDMPRTKIYFGSQKKLITNHWSFPFVAKVPDASARGKGVFLIENQAQLKAYLALPGPAYIQEYLAGARDFRVVVVNAQELLSFERLASEGEFRANLAQGGRIKLGGVPGRAVSTALRAAQTCNLDEIGLDILEHRGRFYVLEANFLFGRQGLSEAGIDFKNHIHQLIISGQIEKRLGLG